ncbi:acyltransferase [Arenimonas caeni]|jgi:1-acyl-sn-glycerol-3-phosphate acyltransferase|uniref:acyltransferase n=1 Tax=Arenimonas caeni TaxID=2058085 RepID=UPI001F0677F8|nr:acyltransferase [Arenimonas caeni]MDY0022339.1 acyltransferase [Arenimonas caeni]
MSSPDKSLLLYLPAPLRVPLAAVLFLLNTAFHGPLLIVAALLKLALPLPPLRRGFDRLLPAIAESWIGVNSAMTDLFTRTRFLVEGLESLRADGRYLVLANHRSWVDIPVLQKVFNRRIPLLRFFLKRQLIWVPVLGLCWWALDFPFMRRATKSQLAKRPELAGRDMAATRKACQKFRQVPASVMNFVEGTRFTPAKQAAQGGGYQHLLRPRAGGVAFVFGAMGDVLDGVLDVTLHYDRKQPSLADLFANRIRTVRVYVRELPVPEGFAGADYEADREFRKRFQAWLNELWEAKDARLFAWEQAAG